MSDNEKTINIGNNVLGNSCMLVDSLLEEIVVSDFEAIEIDKVIKVWDDIKCIDDCKIEIRSKSIFVDQDCKKWVIDILYNVIIKYTTKCGSKHTLERFFFFNKKIPFPVENDEFINYAKLPAYVYVEKAECIDIELKYLNGVTVIALVIELDIQMYATMKKAYPVVVCLPENKKNATTKIAKTKK